MMASTGEWKHERVGEQESGETGGREDALGYDEWRSGACGVCFSVVGENLEGLEVPPDHGMGCHPPMPWAHPRIHVTA